MKSQHFHRNYGNMKEENKIEKKNISLSFRLIVSLTRLWCFCKNISDDSVNEWTIKIGNLLAKFFTHLRIIKIYECVSTAHTHLNTRQSILLVNRCVKKWNRDFELLARVFCCFFLFFSSFLSFDSFIKLISIFSINFGSPNQIKLKCFTIKHRLILTVP